MADDDKLRRPHYPRRNPALRPPPGVQKAMQNFGVPDLRELLDKKHRDQGDSEGDKKLDPKNLPPPDPSYNYLKDPSRDKPKPPSQKRGENRRPQERSHINKDWQRHKNKNEQTENAPPSNTREQEHNNNPHARASFKDDHATAQNVPPSLEDGGQKKELRFSDAPKEGNSEFQNSRTERSSFRRQNPRRGRGGKPREDREEKIENPVNIKIQLSTETGQRSCTLDENTRIADIKHVPEHNSRHRYRTPRGAFRGGRGNFRGRGQGRGSFRERGGMSNKRGGPSHKIDELESLEGADLNEAANEEQNNTRKGTEETNQVAEISQKKTDQVEAAAAENETQVEQYDDYERESNENEEFADSNENYEGEYSSEYQDDSVEYAQNANNESSPKADEQEQKAADAFDPNLAKTITITSSKFQDGEVKRSVEVKATNNSEVEVKEKESSVENK